VGAGACRRFSASNSPRTLSNNEAKLGPESFDGLGMGDGFNEL
jgi:hypothetical protein